MKTTGQSGRPGRLGRFGRLARWNNVGKTHDSYSSHIYPFQQRVISPLQSSESSGQTSQPGPLRSTNSSRRTARTRTIPFIPPPPPMSTFSPAELASWTGGTWHGKPPAAATEIRGVFHDTRSMQPGCLFVAIRGETFDGHAFADRALEAGARVALVDHIPELSGKADGDSNDPGDVHWLVVPDTRKALLDLATGYRECFDIPMIAVTGSVGKTTVKEMVADLLQTLGPTARNPGNWNNDLGLPLSLLNMPRTTRYGVFEIGMNHPGELAPLCDVLRPTHAIVTEIGEAHIEFFDDITGIAEEKATVYRALAEDGVAILDVASEWFEFLAERCNGRMQIIDSDIDPLPGPLAVPGEHMHRNALKAWALARELGVHPDLAARVLAGFRPPGMRWREEIAAELCIINDAYNANPMSMLAALDTFAALPARDHQKWLVLGEMGELGDDRARDAHMKIGARVAPGVADGAWRLITIGEAGRWIANACSGAEVCTDTREAAAILMEQASAGDIVLLKASRSAKLEKVVGELRDLAHGGPATTEGSDKRSATGADAPPC